MLATYRFFPALLANVFGGALFSSVRRLLPLFVLGALATSHAQEITVRGGDGLDVTISDGDTSPRSSDGTDFGSANVTGGSVEHTFRIRNIASNDFNPLTGNLIITSITENSSHFSIVSSPIVTLAEGQFGDLTIRFDPSSDGVKTATVTILNNDSNEGSYTFSIRGEGLGSPEISVFGLPNAFGDGTAISDGDTSPRTADGTDFGTVDALGPNVSHTFRVRNSGTAPLTCSVSDNSANFTVSGLRSSVGVDSADDFTITYNPQSSGGHAATITISNNDSNEDPFTFRVRGFARAPEIAVAGGARRDVNIADGDTSPRTADGTDFGSIDVNGGFIDRIFRIHNTETDDRNPLTGNLVISSITENSSQFSIASGPIAPIPEGGFADFTVRFNPSTVGTHAATVTIVNNDIDGGEGRFTFRVEGDGIGSPEIVVEGRPNTLGIFLPINDGDTTPETGNGTSFGGLGVSAGSVSHQVRVRNTGSAALTVGASEASNAFSISPGSATVSAGSSTIFSVTFNPVVAGPVSADIVFDTNDPDGGEDPYTFRVSGTGTAPEIEVRGGSGFDRVILDGDSDPSAADFTDFGSRDLQAAPLNRTFQIRNLGNENLAIASVTVSDTTNFAVLPGVILPIPPGDAASFTVGFDPVQTGTHTAQVTIQHNDPSGGESPYNFAIEGVGTGSPEIEVFGRPAGPLDGIEIANGDTTADLVDGTAFGALDVNLGPVTHTFRIKNTGSGPLTVGISEDSAAFSLASVATSIPAGGADDFDITFDPSETGEHTADIVITNNDPDGGENPYTFRVAGTGSGPEINVAGGQFLSVPISDGDTTPRPDDHTDFGTVEIGEDSPVLHPFAIRNAARDDFNPAGQVLVIDSITLSGEGADQFAITSVPIVLPMQEGAMAELHIRFAPTEAGTHLATVTIRNNDPDEDPYTFVIRGVATSSAEIAVFGAPVGPVDGILIASGDDTPDLADGTDFGTPDLNGPPTNKVFRVRNTGNTALTVTATDDSPVFAVSGLDASIPAGEFDDFTITFTPAESGTHNATISIANNDPDGGEDPYTFVVEGDGRAPEIAVFGGREFAFEILDGDDTPRSLDSTDFGEADVGDGPVQRTFRISNLQDSDGIPATGNLVISSITEDSDHFAIVSPPILPIEEGATAEFTVSFDPTAVGVHSATVTIVHNDPDGREAPFDFVVTGVGTGEPEIEVYGLPLPLVNDGFEIANGDTTPDAADGTDFGDFDLLGPLPELNHVFRLKNTGSVPLTVAVEDDSGAFRVEGVAGTVAADNIDDFNIIFNPAASGEATATITITSDDADENPYTFVVRGRAVAPEIAVAGGANFDLEILDEDFSPRAEDGTDFGSASVAGGAVERSFRIRNLQPSDGSPVSNNLVITSITTDDPQFMVVTPPLLPIPEEGEADFTVRFDPAAIGEQEAVVTIVHNDPDGAEDPFRFAIRGEGQGEPEIAVTGLPIPGVNDGVPIANGDETPDLADGTDFRRVLAGSPTGGAANTFRIRNSGDAILQTTVSLDSDQFEITIPPVSSVPASGFTDFTIQFKPNTDGVHSALVTIANNDPDGGENPYTFKIQGEAFAPEIQVRGGPAFERLIRSGDFEPRPEDNTDFGITPLSGAVERTFRIFNIAPENGSPLSGQLNIQLITVDDTENFSISSGAPLVPIPILVQEQTFHDFTVRFDPTEEGDFATNVAIFHNDPDDAEQPYLFTVIARAGDPDIEVRGGPGFPVIADGDTDPSVQNDTDFGSMKVGERPVEHDFRIVNEGASQLVVEVVSDTPEFVVPGFNEARRVAPGDVLNFEVHFDPAAAGVKEGTISITSNDPDENPYTFRVRGEAVAPQIEVFGGSALDLSIENGDETPAVEDGTIFGEAEVGETGVVHTFRIVNQGTAELRIDLSENSVDFAIGEMPETVAAGSSEDFTVSFLPTGPGRKSATIRISNDTPDEDPYTFEVAGTGRGSAFTNKIATRFNFKAGAAGPNMQFRSAPGKTYCITTSTDLVTFEVIPELTGIAGTGDLVGVDLSAYLPSATNQRRFFRVEEE